MALNHPDPEYVPKVHAVASQLGQGVANWGEGVKTRYNAYCGRSTVRDVVMEEPGQVFKGKLHTGFEASWVRIGDEGEGRDLVTCKPCLVKLQRISSLKKSNHPLRDTLRASRVLGGIKPGEGLVAYMQRVLDYAAACEAKEASGDTQNTP